MTQPGITVGICTLDRPEGLARCLDALLAGTRLPDEILVVDQGRSAAAVDVVGQRQRQHPSLRHIRQHRLGLSASRNAVIEHARQPIVAVTDDDCVPDAEWLAAIARAFDTPPAPDAVTGRVLALPVEEGRPHAVSLRTGTDRTDFTGDALPWHVGTGANFAVYRAFVTAAGGYDERFGTGSPGHAGEDIELALRLLRSGGRIRYEPDAVVYHQRQCDARRLATRWSYAHGIGALAGMLGRRGDRLGARMMTASVRGALVRLIRAVGGLDRSGVHQALLTFTGLVRGALYGCRLAAEPSRGQLREPHVSTESGQ